MDSATPSASGQNSASNPVFSGPAPTTNPFSGQNSIPSSATGDVVVSSDKPNPKKGLIIALVAIGILVIGAIIAALILSSQSHNSATSPAATLSDVKSSFTALANTLISGDKSTDKTPNFTTSITDWQLTKIFDSSNPDTQSAYADALNNMRNAYYSNVVGYISQNSEKNLSEFTNQSDILNDKLIASVIFLRGDKFVSNLPTTYLENPSAVNDAVREELESSYEVFDSSSAELIGDIAAYYDAVIDRLLIYSEHNCFTSTRVNETCVAELRANYDTYPDLRLVDGLTYTYTNDANAKFKSLALELPTLLSDLNNIVKGLDG